MRYKYLLPVLLCFTLSACAQTAPAEPPDSPDEPPATVAPIKGETVSPDGKWEIVQEGGDEGITSGGLHPCEAVKIVNRDSGEVLWEDDGAYLLHAAWPEGSEFAVVARTARTWTQVTVVSTESGTACPVLLPGENPIPEYTFLAEEWIGWTDENTFELRLDGGDGVGTEVYYCSPIEDGTREPLHVSVVKLCYEDVPGEYDFTHDGQPETVQLITVVGDSGRTDGAIVPLWFELHILNDDDETIWAQRHIALQHIGWANLFACTLDGKDYILDYNPYANQGLASYSYRLFSLTEAGEEVLLKENNVWFDMNFGSPIFTGEYDPAAIGAFMDDVHAYLDQSVLLISTQHGRTTVGGAGADYRGDGFFDEALYSYDGTWEERFARYREEMEAE